MCLHLVSNNVFNKIVGLPKKESVELEPKKSNLFIKGILKNDKNRIFLF